MANLLPCPFCGSTEILFTENENRVGYHYCKKCWGRVGPECQTFTESVHNWNKRVDIMEGANLQTHNTGSPKFSAEIVEGDICDYCEKLQVGGITCGMCPDHGFESFVGRKLWAGA